ncbi:MAG TPA: CotH kinase family protein, partial [Flavobacteriales bacterium]|nr:CotH kinase family protein [Flavobacteriales bacterium]
MNHLWLIACMFSFVYIGKAQVVINEVCTHNASVVNDLDGDTPDWVELYNAGVANEDISGFGLSDENSSVKYIFPPFTLAPGQFKLIFISDKNLYGTQWHTNFQLKKGETLYLFNYTGAILDQLNGDELHDNDSRGRYPDGAGTCYFDVPTPGASNNTSTAYSGYTANVQANYAPGFYAAAINLTMSSVSAGAQIHYTVNGNKALASSPVCTALAINQTTTVRSVAVATGLLPSEEYIATYFINANHNLPVISIITDSLHLWDYDSGIFVMGPGASSTPPYYGANFWLDLEYPAVFELYQNQSLVFSQQIGLAIHGGSVNRQQPMKSLRLTARDKYSKKKMEYPFFEERTNVEYEELVLRNGSSDFCLSHMRDELTAENLFKETANDVLVSRPAIAYINGVYWGIYNLKEKRGKYNLAQVHNVDEDSLDIIRDNIYAWEGDTLAFHTMHNYVMTHDLSNNAFYNVFSSHMDIENFTDYYIGEIYYGNFDWPYGNIECWRERKPGSKFRYIFFDLDVAFTGTPWQDHTYNLWTKIFSDYCDPNKHINLFEAALTNTGFHHNFVNRYCDLLNTIFTPEHQLQKVGARENAISGEVNHHF